MSYHFLGHPRSKLHVRLPGPTVQLIFSFLSASAVELASQTCKQWRRCVIKTQVWAGVAKHNLRRHEKLTRELVDQHPEALLEQFNSEGSDDRGEQKHRHFELTIEVPKTGDYILEVKELEDTDKCNPTLRKSAKPRAAAKKNSCIIEICSKLPRGMELELAFCRRVISQRYIHAHTYAD